VFNTAMIKIAAEQNHCEPASLNLLQYCPK